MTWATGWWLAMAAIGLSRAATAERAVTADPQSGQIRVETERYSARFDDGVLTYLYSKPGRLAFIGGEQPPAAVTNRTGLYVEDEPRADPFWLLPRREGAPCSAITVKQESPRSVTVTYQGLAPQGWSDAADAAGQGQAAAVSGVASGGAGGQTPARGTNADARPVGFRPDATLRITVAVDELTGDLLVSTAGTTKPECLVGSGFAFSGIMPKYVLYAAKACGLRQVSDPHKQYFPLACTLEWGNYTMSKRPGLSGELWNAPVTVIGAVDRPEHVFAIWCEDDEPFYKFFVGSRDGVTYATYSHTPYAENRATQSAVWRLNVYDGGWTAAAKPFAESLPRRGFTKTRAPWAKDISVIVQVSDLGDSYLRPLEELFPPEDRARVMLYVQVWRKAGFDHNMWDYEPTDAFKTGVVKAKADGFRVLTYVNPMICWGKTNDIADPVLREKVVGFKANGELDPINLELLPYAVHLNLAYRPWREYHWGIASNLVQRHGVDGFYLDCTYSTLPDGRGNIDGMNAYQGFKEYLDGLRRIRPDIYIGTEQPNELVAWGADFGLHLGLEWATGSEENRTRKTHPIMNYLYQHVLTTMIHSHSPYHYIRTTRHYHLSEEIAERAGQVAAMGFEPSFEASPVTPAITLWKKKATLFAHRGLHPFFPVKWEPGVMSYYRAEDGAVFVYEETDYGSRLVERRPWGRDVVHYARAWKKTAFKSRDGKMLGWIGQADDGTYIGLDNVNNAYVLLPDAEPDPRLRVAELTDNVRITDFRVTDDLATLDLASPSGQVSQVHIRLITAKPPVRLAAPGQPRIAVDAQGRATVPANGAVAVIWTDGVIGPFEYAGRYLLPVPKGLAGTPEKGIRQRLGGEWDPYSYRFRRKADEWDQTWNAPLLGPANPRPGTIYRFTFTARRPPASGTNVPPRAVHVASHLTTWGTGIGAFFQASGALLWLTNDAPVTVVNAGVRNTNMTYAMERVMALATGGGAVVTNISPIEFIRPELALPESGPINLGAVKPGEASAPSAPRRVVNGQRLTIAAGTNLWRTVLYGTAHVTVPSTNKPYLQTIDYVGVTLAGDQAARFELTGPNATPDGQGIKLIGTDGLSGLVGGEAPESEPFAVRFRGTDKPGDYAATVRITTQAGNTGTLSKGDRGEPLAGLYYCDIPVSASVSQSRRGIEGAAPLPAPACRGEAKRRRAGRGSAAAPPPHH